MNIKKPQYLFFAVLLGFVLSNCSSNTAEAFEVKTTVNPFKIAPLTALLQIDASKPGQGTVTILGESPMEYPFKM